MRDWIQLDELHVVSDLHLGGKSGFQIFASAAELAWVADSVAQSKRAGPVALLINGDFIDFLAEEPSAYFDPDGVLAKIDRVVADPAFAPVFAALRRLVSAPNRLLAINLGNHDLELALPWARAHLVECICGADLAARARLVLVNDGTGFRCQVGRATVVCVHGNEVDSWNVADYEQLRRIGRDGVFGLAIEPWTPNAGTQMVIDVMNRIKRDYPFVDLLKPETEGVLPILAALNPGLHRNLLDLAGVAGRKAFDMARMKAGFLDASQPVDAPAVAPQPVYRASRPLGMVGTRNADAALMDQVETAWRSGVTPISLVRGTQSQQLNFWSATWDFVTAKPRHEVLREALSGLDKDRSFEFGTVDDTFRELDEQLAADIDIVIAGHTHLERSIARQRGRGHYFNSGTWARLMRIAPATRQDEAKFKQLFQLLSGGTMAALDAEPGLVERRNTVVSVWTDPAGATQAELRHVQGGAVPAATAFVPVAGSRFTKS